MEEIMQGLHEEFVCKIKFLLDTFWENSHLSCYLRSCADERILRTECFLVLPGSRYEQWRLINVVVYTAFDI